MTTAILYRRTPSHVSFGITPRYLLRATIPATGEIAAIETDADCERIDLTVLSRAVEQRVGTPVEMVLAS